MSEWIKCSERMPEDGEEVLIYMNGAYQDSIRGFKWDNGFHRDGVAVEEPPTHWMPLPEPPQES